MTLKAHFSRLHLFFSFLLIVILVGMEVVVDLYHAESYKEQLDRVLATHNNKVRIVHEMRTLVRERVISLNTMLLVDDPFEAEEAYEQFLAWGNRFIEKRRQLIEVIDTQEEEMLLEDLRQQTILGTPIIERAVNLARAGEKEQSRDILVHEVQPMQEKVRQSGEELLQYYLDEVSLLASEAQRKSDKWRRYIWSLGMTIILLVIVIAAFVMKRIKKDRGELEEAKSSLEEAVVARTQELQDTAEQLNEAQRIAGMGHWEWHIPSGGLMWSDEIYRIFGFTPDEFAPSYEAFLAAVHPGDRDKVVNAVNDAVAGRRAYSLEHRVVQPDGTLRIVYEQGVVSREDDGSPVRMLGTVQDITEQKATEKELRLAASVFHSTGDGVMIADKDCRIVEVNEAICDIFGYDKEELVGNNPSMLRSGRHDESFFQQFWESINKTGQWQGEIWDRRKSGEVIPLWLTVNAVKDESHVVTSYVALFRDITKSKETEQHLWQIAHHDALTGLPNRSLMYARLQLATEQADREKSAMALMLIDLDGFKVVNDTLGHGAGDEVLVQVASILNHSVRESDTVVRYAGDEFVVVLKGLFKRDAIAELAEKIIRRISEPMMVEGQEVKVGASIGIALYPTSAYDADSLIARADDAMYRAKKGGKGCYRFYDS